MLHRRTWNLGRVVRLASPPGGRALVADAIEPRSIGASRPGGFER